MLSARVYCNSIPKAGSGEIENEDAIAVHPWRRVQKLTRLRCAIADGATQASFSRLWANILVENAIKSNLTPSLKKTKLLMNNSYEKWQSNIERIKLPWFAVEKAEKGAYSSFLWVSINSTVKGIYANLSAVSVGDSELIIVRSNDLFRAHPLNSSIEFNSSPMLISSKKEKNSNLKLNTIREKVVAGDDIILVTDSLAKYLLTQFEIGNNPLNTFQPFMQTAPDQTLVFRSWIESKRQDRLLKNDDSTMIWIHLFDDRTERIST